MEFDHRPATDHPATDHPATDHPATDHPAAGTPLRFGCDECSLRHTAHCEDCLLTHMCSEEDGSVVVSLDDLRLVRRLQAGGLVPPLRHRRSVS